jgi:hypothetical protein
VIVGFNSCGWTEQEFGNQNCFLLNVTQNIRLEPIRQLKGYQATYTMVKETTYIDGEGRQCTGKNLMFGNNALVIQPDFKTVTSDMSNSYFYALNGEITMRDYAPRSIIPSQKVFKPSKVELWVFDRDENSMSQMSGSQAHQFNLQGLQREIMERTSDFSQSGTESSQSYS